MGFLSLFGLGGDNKSGSGVLGTAKDLVGSVTSLPMNIAGMIAGAVKSKRAKAMSPGLYNPLQMDLLQQVQQKKKALETGMAYKPIRDEIDATTAQAFRTATNLAGGDVGMNIAALKGINRSGGRNLNQLFQGMSNEGTQLFNVLGGLTQSMANRQYQISMADKLQSLAEGQQLLKDSTQGLRTSLSLGLDKMNVGDVAKSYDGLQDLAGSALHGWANKIREKNQIGGYNPGPMDLSFDVGSGGALEHELPPR